MTFAGPKAVELCEVEVPEPGPDEVRVRTAYSGISQGTERWLLMGRYNDCGARPELNYPCFPGYQASGIVEMVGEGVDDLLIGDAVALQGTRFHDPNLRNPGPGLASHVGLLVAPRTLVVPLRPEVRLAEASLYRMAAVARHGARLTGIKAGDIVVVIGLGMIGQMAAQAARRLGARVVAADKVAGRVAAAAKHSADIAVDVSRTSLEEVVSAEAPEGADVVVDTTGSSAIFPQCVDLVRYEGRICLQGYYPDPIPVAFHPTHLKRATVTFPCGWDGPEADAELADDLANNAVAIAPLITHRFSFAAASAAYEMVLDQPEQTLGMVFDWSDRDLG